VGTAIKEADVFDPVLHYKLYRVELARWEDELARRQMVPRRERNWLPRLRLAASRKRRRQTVAARGVC
jgi:hypothetical protein